LPRSGVWTPNASHWSMSPRRFRQWEMNDIHS
jgi:hypothetical protein